jgi:hypothetical protein
MSRGTFTPEVQRALPRHSEQRPERSAHWVCKCVPFHYTFVIPTVVIPTVVIPTVVISTVVIPNVVIPTCHPSIYCPGVWRICSGPQEMDCSLC